MSAVKERLINDLTAKVMTENIDVRDTIAQAFQLGEDFANQGREE
jgi:hypothetical protein